MKYMWVELKIDILFFNVCMNINSIHSNMDNPKTRQEKKSRGKFYGKAGPEVYTQKHIRAHENLAVSKAKTDTQPPVSTKPQTNKRKKR